MSCGEHIHLYAILRNFLKNGKIRMHGPVVVFLEASFGHTRIVLRCTTFHLLQEVW